MAMERSYKYLRYLTDQIDRARSYALISVDDEGKATLVFELGEIPDEKLIRAKLTQLWLEQDGYTEEAKERQTVKTIMYILKDFTASEQNVMLAAVEDLTCTTAD